VVYLLRGVGDIALANSISRQREAVPFFGCGQRPR